MQKDERNKETQIVMNWLERLGVEFQTGFIVTNPQAENNPIIYANKSFCEMSGYPLHEVVGRNGKFLHGSKTNQEVSRQIRECIDAGTACVKEIINYRKDGMPFWVEITIQPINVDEPDSRFMLLLTRDITDRKRTEALIKLQQETYNDLEKGYTLNVLLQKACTTVESFFQDGAKCSVILNGGEDEFQPDMSNFLLSNAGNEMAMEKAETSDSLTHFPKETVAIKDPESGPFLATYQETGEQYGLFSSWSLPILDSAGDDIGTFGIYFQEASTLVATDRNFIRQIAPVVSLTIKYFRQQEEMMRLAFLDKESDLPNRNYFMNEIGALIEEDEEGFVAFISVDEYVRIVDQYGHRAGDVLVQKIGKRFLLASLPQRSLVARFSDSTLAIFCMTSLSDVPDTLKILTQCAAEPVTVDDLELFLTLKMGVAIITQKQRGSDEVIRHADSALSKAKVRAGESICYYENEHDEFMMRDLRVGNELTAAIKREEIDVHLQPKVELISGKVIGYEALARWFTADLGTISPEVFIPVAEKNGKIRELEQLVMKKVVNWLKNQLDLGCEISQVAVNISTDHFFHQSFIPYLMNITSRYGIEPKWIRLEIMERIGFVDIETAYTVFNRLKTYGFTCSIDDFGTGYSSLSYLQKLPIHEIKIDRAFISKIHEPQTMAIVRTIIQLAENLQMMVVAEGIETEEQRKLLINLGCRVGQGFYFYRPMPFDKLDSL